MDSMLPRMQEVNEEGGGHHHLSRVTGRSVTSALGSEKDPCHLRRALPQREKVVGPGVVGIAHLNGDLRQRGAREGARRVLKMDQGLRDQSPSASPPQPRRIHNGVLA